MPIATTHVRMLVLLAIAQVERSILERFGQPASGVVQRPEGALSRATKAFEVTAMRCVPGSLLPMRMFSQAEPEKIYSPKGSGSWKAGAISASWGLQELGMQRTRGS